MVTWPDPERMRDVAEADVYKSGGFAGTLHREGDDVVFEYAEAYRADEETPQVAFTLPKRLSALLTERRDHLRRSA